MTILRALLILAAWAGVALATIREVGPGGYATIGAALAEAAAGDEIVVGPGRWNEGPLTLSFDLTLRSAAGSGETILDGAQAHRCLLVTNNAEVLIEGFAFEDARAEDGAALHVQSGADVIVSGCVFRQNKASHTGGAAFVRHAGTVLTFLDCDFSKNYAPLNAGCVGVSLQSRCNFHRCTFWDNTSDDMSGAVANFANSLLEIRGCVFYANTGGECGAIRIYDSPAIIVGNTFWGNESTLGSIYLNPTGPVELSNNIIAHERSGFGVRSTITPIGGCNIHFANARGSVYGYALPASDRIVDPLFCDAEGRDLTVCADSPAAGGLCGPVGALDPVCAACAPIAEEVTAWGRLKAVYR